jgi:hypothetical protein
LWCRFSFERVSNGELMFSTGKKFAKICSKLKSKHIPVENDYY